ncbi:MAG: C13 family peptidase [Promethearchaeota archaeon]
MKLNISPKVIKYGTLVVFVIILGLIISYWIIYLPSMQRVIIPGEKKAIILSSANDFYRKEGEPDFNEGDEGKFSAESSDWEWGNQTNGYGGPDNNYQNGHDGLPGALQLIALSSGYVNLEFVYNWTAHYPLYKYAVYYLSAWVNLSTNAGVPVIISLPGAGARVGLRWLNSSNAIVRTDWSNGIYDTLGKWNFLNVTGIADNSTGWNEITQLQLVLSVEGVMNAGDQVLFDDVRVEEWFPPPIPIPPPINTDTDGFPAQALQVYWILKNHGYTDDNIFLMLYHTNDSVIDINATDGIANDLTGAVVDVENDDVNASRFKQELNISIPDSFASNIRGKDKLIIYMVDHGSNNVVGGGNASFHFEADDSFISETEFYNLVKKINCARLLINIDICFSGNFLNRDSAIGESWYEFTPKTILITSTTDSLSWYWRDNTNPDGFAGSWFFHYFWEKLNQGKTIGTAFNYAVNVIPSGRMMSINDTQSPLIYDKLNLKDTWGFNGNPSL